jgi:hypothetical protein
MLTGQEAHRRVRTLCRSHKVVLLEALFEALGTRSRMSVFRRLREVGYNSSYTHAGRYYTLEDVPTYDEHGLWFFRDIGFSKAGTLKETLVIEVEQSPAGRTHAELQHLLRVRVHNTLLSLVQQGRIGRRAFDGVHVYVSADATRAAAQMAGRQMLAAEAVRVVPAEHAVEILVEALRCAPHVPAAAAVAERLAARGLRLGAHDVEQVFAAYDLMPGKKTAR